MLSIKNAVSGVILIYIKRSRNNAAFDIYSPYGFGGILFWGDAISSILPAFESWMRANQIITAYLMAHPVVGNLAEELFFYPRTAYVLALSASEEELWRGLASSHTQELKKLFKDSGISVTDNKDEIKAVLPTLYRDTLDRVGAGSAYFFNDETLSGLVHDQYSIVLGAKVNGIIHAVVLINFSSACAEYFINATDEQGRHLTRLLLWEAIKKLKALGIPEFNLGGGSSEGDQLEAFKKRFGGVSKGIPLYRKIVDKDQYQALCKEYGKDPEELSYFPPYWKN